VNPLIRKVTEFHTLPPEPEEEVKSRVRSSQGPIALAIDKETNGIWTTVGEESVIFCELFVGHWEQVGSILDVHRAFQRPLLTSKTYPGLIFEPKEEISSEESLIQRQREVEERVEVAVVVVLKSNLQFITLITWALLVGEVNVRIILLPSEEKMDDWMTGEGNSFSNAFTTNTSPRGYITL
jgi:hypothetical protein